RLLLGPATGTSACEQTPPEHLARRVDIPDLVQEPTEVAPARPIQQEVVAFDDDEPRRPPDRDGAGHRLFYGAVEPRPENGRSRFAPHVRDRTNEALYVERLGSSLHPE